MQHLNVSIWKLYFGINLTCPSPSNLEQFYTFKQTALSFMLSPPHTAPLSLRAQILHSNLPLI